jgi:hypothetical protein
LARKGGIGYCFVERKTGAAVSEVAQTRVRGFATMAFWLGVASVALLGLGFGAVFTIPYLGLAFLVAPASAIGALTYGVISLRRPRDRLSTRLAVSGLGLGLLVLLAFMYIFVAFAVNPPE